ncbi:nitrate reductase molybdenum cofactor assembly chaperone [Nakamurella lactea]|uniref:nitrate reductase molybdenum cofactor assembly chaperone n=1 Tax=Nakamurella lactea TaxID=459515 RepID=UPI000417BF4F|nr:nitrate reductase molybdenum cofactor assembly chaperone [Nakamurella lactea]
MRRTVSRRAPGPWSAGQLATGWQCASLLLGYPDQTLLDNLAVVSAAAARLARPLGEPLGVVCERLTAAALPELQADYVETFDSRRRCNLYLTYFLYGDTRKRGAALLRFKQTYRESGFALPDSGENAELPDHLCVVLEYAATVDGTRGRELLLEHRAGLELLRISLRDSDSRWAPVLEAVSATLPPLRGDEDEAIRRLAAEGPPDEEVGMSPYAMPERPPAAGGSVDLPMPSFQGAGR